MENMTNPSEVLGKVKKYGAWLWVSDAEDLPDISGNDTMTISEALAALREMVLGLKEKNATVSEYYSGFNEAINKVAELFSEGGK
jgi:hypothetical protein